MTAAEEDASLATSRWCWSRNCRRATTGHPCSCCRCCCWSHRSHCSCLSPFPCPSPCLCRHCWGWGQEGEGEGPLEGMAFPVVVGAEAVAAVEGALLLRAWSRTWRHALGRRVVQLDLLEFEVTAYSVEGRERLRLLAEDLHVIKPLVQTM
jgi:hypothetical protein